MHREEVGRDRQRKDDRQRQMEGGQRQACTGKRWKETDKGRMTVRDIRRMDRDRHAEERIGTETVDKVDIRTAANDDKMLMDINSYHLTFGKQDTINLFNCK